MNNIKIDREKCIHCGLCIRDCVSSCIDFDEEEFPKMIDEKTCIACQHCLAICPTGALSFNGKSPENSEETDRSELLSLIKSRRSVRQYTDEEIDEETFQKLKEMLPYIPTGCNARGLHFTIVESKAAMDVVRNKVNQLIIKALNNKLLSPLVNKFSRYKNAFENGEDVIFRGAPHMIIVSSKVTAPCATVDPIIALSYIELYAQSLGLGTCWCGFAQICMKFLPEICEMLEIPPKYAPVYVMLLGNPKVNYPRTTQPEPYKINSVKEINDRFSCIWCKTKRFFTNFLR